MEKPVCASCGMRGACRNSAASWLFFFIGIIATIAMRIIEPLNLLNPLYGKLAWYVGVSGFFLFFVYKYREMKVRSRLIEELGLIPTLASERPLGKEERMLLAELVCSQNSWKERANFFAIFSLSALALIFSLYMDSLN